MKVIELPWSFSEQIDPPSQEGVASVMGVVTQFNFTNQDEPSVGLPVDHPLEGTITRSTLDGAVVYQLTDGDFSRSVDGKILSTTFSAAETALEPDDYYIEIRDATGGAETVLYQRLWQITPSPKYSPITTPPTVIIGISLGGTGSDMNGKQGIWWQESAGAPVTSLAVGAGLSVITISGVKTLVAGGGAGDMTKAIYDTDNDAIVNAAADSAALQGSAGSYYLNRANHTGTQIITTVAGLQGALDAKADLVGGKVPASQIPDIAVSEFLGAVADQAAMLALVGQRGDWAVRTDTEKVYVLIGEPSSDIANWRVLAYPAPPPSMAIGVGITGGTAGRVLFEGPGGVLADSPYLLFQSDVLISQGGVNSGPRIFTDRIQGASAALTTVLNTLKMDVGAPFYLYDLDTDVSNYSRLFTRYASGSWTIGTEAAGTGTAHKINILNVNSSLLVSNDDGTLLTYSLTNGFAALSGFSKIMHNDGALNYNGHAFWPQVNNSVDLGTSSLGFKNLWLTGSLIAGGITSPGAGANSEHFGSGAVASGIGAISFGKNAAATANNAMAIGESAAASSTNGMSLGTASSASGGNDATAIGVLATATGASALAIGTSAAASTHNAVAIGKSAVASVSFGIAIGPSANAGHASIAIGLQSATTADNQLMLGSSYLPIDHISTYGNMLALRGGTNPQEFQLYNTYIDASDYERTHMRWASGRFEIGTAAAGTGTLRPMRIEAVTRLTNFDDGLFVSANGVVKGFTMSVFRSAYALEVMTGVLGSMSAMGAFANGGLVLGSGTTNFPPIDGLFSSGDIQTWRQISLLRYPSYTSDVDLLSESAGVLAQRSGMTAQESRLYNKYTDASNYERFYTRYASGSWTIGTEAAGTGVLRSMTFKIGGTTMTIPSSFGEGYDLAFTSGGIFRVLELGGVYDGAADIYFLGYPAFASNTVLENYAGKGVILSVRGVVSPIRGFINLVETFQFDGNTTAGNTRFLVYDVDSGLLQRVKVGANGTGPGGVGRALYLDDV